MFTPGARVADNAHVGRIEQVAFLSLPALDASAA